MDFRYINTDGDVSVAATYDAGVWTFNDTVTMNDLEVTGSAVVEASRSKTR
ncbi:MAG: hypothetical protein ACRDPY_42910 [Streptosporangiaceae bacterium]